MGTEESVLLIFVQHFVLYRWTLWYKACVLLFPGLGNVCCPSLLPSALQTQVNAGDTLQPCASSAK